MKSKQYLIILILPIAFLGSCGRISIEDELWQPESLPVVFAILSPGNEVGVYLNRTSLNNSGTDTVNYQEAEVLLRSETSDWVTLRGKSPGDNIYSDLNRELKIVAGETYYLEVNLPGFIITSATTIPDSNNAKIKSAKFTKSTEGIAQNEYVSGLLEATFDIKPENYCILTNHLGNSLVFGGTFIRQNYFSKRITVADSVQNYTLHLHNVDTFLARFLAAKSISNMQHFSNGDITALMGSFNGILPHYSNISNGIGLFGSYVSTTYTVPLK